MRPMANPEHIPPPLMAKQFGIGKLTRHLFVCVGPDCVAPDVGEQTWEYLKKRLKQLNLAGPMGRVSHQVQLPAHLHGRSDRGRVSGRDVVPERHAG
jgi:hypothetical protein